jgi:hypothetical protein
MREVAHFHVGKTLKLDQALYKQFTANTPAQKRFRYAKALSRREIKLRQWEGSRSEPRYAIMKRRASKAALLRQGQLSRHVHLSRVYQRLEDSQ